MAPVIVNNLKIIHASLDMNDPCNTAVYACTMITFYCIARLGEFSVPNICKRFEPTKYITCQDISALKDQNGLSILRFRILVTKCEAIGEVMQCAPQAGCITDVEAAHWNHLHLNLAPPDAHLFTWMHPKSGLCPLSKTQVMKNSWRLPSKAT